MTDDPVETLVDGIAERLVTRVRARDRLDAVDESASGPTFAARLHDDDALLAGLVDEAIGESLAALTEAEGRRALRALCRGDEAAATEALARAGLVTASWTGETVAASPAGRVVSTMLDDLGRRVTTVLRRRLEIDDGR